MAPQAAQSMWDFVFSLDFEFIRKCLKINKVRSTFHFLTKIEIKRTHLVSELYYDKTAELYPDPLSAPGAPTLQQFRLLMKNVKY